MRSSGILMHITSLPSPYGIGTLGKAAFDFVDYLKKSGQSYWQILPVTPTSYGDSPYQSFSTFAGNPYFIDLDILAEEGLLEKADYAGLSWGDDPKRVDYARIYQLRFPVLKKAYDRFCQNIPADFAAFCGEQRDWLEEYALFMSLKDAHGGRSWQRWEDSLRLREDTALEQARNSYQQQIEFWRFVQYEFYRQWRRLKDYANQNEVKIIGDIPIYVAEDSADVWANPQMFRLDADRRPIEVAGCPPDYFAKTGQLWGNPIYDWDYCKTTGYSWWIRRIQTALALYDTVRIDHFRGFESYWAVPAADETAENGVWKPGPGIALFRAVEQQLGQVSIIAEDLGTITDEVRALLKESGYPGMKVLQFAFSVGNESDYLPHNYGKNCVCYTGTHDNDTLAGWLASINESDREYTLRYCRASGEEVWGLIAAAWGSTAAIAVTTMQDLLELDSGARMNIPSTPSGNWQWRSVLEDYSDSLAKRLDSLTRLYWRHKRS